MKPFPAASKACRCVPRGGGEIRGKFRENHAENLTKCRDFLVENIRESRPQASRASGLRDETLATRIPRLPSEPGAEGRRRRRDKGETSRVRAFKIRPSVEIF